jgi:hypothetical protein
VYRSWPKWEKYGRFADFKVGQQVPRPQFDSKLLIVFLANKSSRSTSDPIRRAEKAGISVAIQTEREPLRTAETGRPW